MPTQPLVPKGGKVCIVGGGTVGILAAKNCIAEGFLPTVFEQTQRVGGVWRLDDAPNRVAYESLYTNSSGAMMGISDFPLPQELQDVFPTRQDICDYYERYVDKFHLDKYIKFGARVESVRRDAAAGWVVEVSQAQGREEHTFDAIFLCAGQFREPLVPEIPGAERFRGRVSHSAAYRNAAGLAGKRVVVVGNGNSALDISLEAARAGATVTVLCRSGNTVIPVADFHGRPVDQMLNTRTFTAIPGSLRKLLFYRLVSGNTSEFVQKGMPQPPTAAQSLGFANLKEHVAYRQLMGEGRIKLIGGALESLGENSVITAAGAEIGADEVILCTGYRLAFSFLEPSLAEDFVLGHSHLNAYRRMMHPKEPTLCALGYLLTFGNESCVGEMQGRWALAVWSGRIPLPSPQQLEADLARRRRGGKYPQFTSYISYMDALAKECGADPPKSWQLLLQNPALFWKFYAAAAVPTQWRLRGPHSWEGAADFIRSQPSVAFRFLELLWAPPHKEGARPAKPSPLSKL